MIATECPTCRSPIPADAPAGLCPRCLVGRALGNDLGHSVLAETTGIFPVSADVPTAAEVDRLIPELEVLELIGHGGMGVVYLARQPKLDRRVALKLLSPRFAADPTFAERFDREARSLARLNHPNVLGIYDKGRVGDHYYLVLEYVEGTSLRELVGSEPLGTEQAIDVARQVCQALQFAHERGIVHRDVKPENVLVDEDMRVKLADFGLAKLVDSPVGEASLTLTKQVMGTPHYMAPEAVRRGSGEADPRGDVYAVGVILYEALTGQLPLGRFQAPSMLGHGDARLDEVVLRALASDPASRHASAAELDRALAGLSRVDRLRADPMAPTLPVPSALAEPERSWPARPLAERLALVSCGVAVFPVVLSALALVVGTEGGDNWALLAKLLGGTALLTLLLSAGVGRVAIWQGDRGWPLSGLPRLQALLGPALLSCLLFGVVLLIGPTLAAVATETQEYTYYGEWREIPDVWKLRLRRFLGALIFSSGLVATWFSACPGLMRRVFYPLFPRGDSAPLWMLTLTSMALLMGSLFVL
jgi:aminoglycoside phosphotransferase (APT) family kinase protein